MERGHGKCPETARQISEELATAREHDDVRSFGGEPLGDGKADARRCAADDGRPALESQLRDRAGNSDIYVMNADGSGVRNLTRSAADEHTVTWSPDGRKIAFVRSLDGGNSSDIYVMNADDSGQRRLTRNAGWLVWSPAQRK